MLFGFTHFLVLCIARVSYNGKIPLSYKFFIDLKNSVFESCVVIFGVSDAPFGLESKHKLVSKLGVRYSFDAFFLLFFGKITFIFLIEHFSK